jgi:hypothetical protein
VQGADDPAGEPVTLSVPVRIAWADVARVVVSSTTTNRLFVGTTLRMAARAEHADGSARTNPDVEWRSGTPSVATVDGFGRVTAMAPGTATITATVEGVEGAATLSAEAFAGETLTITGGEHEESGELRVAGHAVPPCVVADRAPGLGTSLRAKL